MSSPRIGSYTQVPPADSAAQTLIARELANTEKNIARILEWDSYFASQKGHYTKRFFSAVSHILHDLHTVKTELLAAKTTISTILFATHRATAQQAFTSASRRAAVLLADVEAHDAAECADRPDFLEPLTPSRRPPSLLHRASVRNDGP